MANIASGDAFYDNFKGLKKISGGFAPDPHFSRAFGASLVPLKSLKRSYGPDIKKRLIWLFIINLM